MDRSNPEWYDVMNAQGSVGFVPATYLSDASFRVPAPVPVAADSQQQPYHKPVPKPPVATSTTTEQAYHKPAPKPLAAPDQPYLKPVPKPPAKVKNKFGIAKPVPLPPVKVQSSAPPEYFAEEEFPEAQVCSSSFFYRFFSSLPAV